MRMISDEVHTSQTIYTKTPYFWFNRPEAVWIRSQMCCRC
jgi:hypothetical protein